MLSKKMQALLILCLLSSIPHLISMEMPPAPSSEPVIPQPSETVDISFIAHLIPQPVLAQAPQAPQPPEPQSYCPAEAYGFCGPNFWRYVIGHLEHCPAELLPQLIQRAQLLQQPMVVHNALPILTDTPTGLPVTLVSHPYMHQGPSLLPFQVVERQQSRAIAPEAQLVNPTIAVSSEKEEGSFAQKTKRNKHARFKEEKGSIKRITPEYKQIIAEILATNPPVGHSSWTAALLCTALRAKHLHFDEKRLDSFLNREK